MPDDLTIPFNYEAAGLEADEPKKSCCGPNGHSASEEEVSTDSESTVSTLFTSADLTRRPVSLPVPSAKDTDVPPIDETAGAMGRTAPVNGADSHVIPKKKGCGRADCCQLGPGEKSTVATAPTPSFPRFEFKPYQPGAELIFPPSLANHQLKPLKMGSEARTWYRPTTLAQLLELKKTIPDAKLVGGSSEVAIEVAILGRTYPSCIYVADIPELYAVQAPDLESDSPSLTFGGNYPLSELEALCKQLSKDLPASMVGPINAIKTQLR